MAQNLNENFSSECLELILRIEVIIDVFTLPHHESEADMTLKLLLYV